MVCESDNYDFRTREGERDSHGGYLISLVDAKTGVYRFRGVLFW